MNINRISLDLQLTSQTATEIIKFMLAEKQAQCCVLIILKNSTVYD